MKADAFSLLVSGFLTFDYLENNLNHINYIEYFTTTKSTGKKIYFLILSTAVKNPRLSVKSILKPGFTGLGSASKPNREG